MNSDVAGGDVYGVPERLPRPKAGRKRKTKKGSGRSFLPLAFGLVGLGLIGVVGFFAVRFAADALHSEPPVFAVSTGRAAYEMEIDAFTLIDLQMAKVSSNLKFEFQEGPDQRILTLTHYEASFGPLMSQKSLTLTPSSLIISRGIMDKDILSAEDAQPEMAAAIRAMGRPFCRFPVPSDGVAAVELLNSPGFFDAEYVHAQPLFITPPFATNVDWWDVDQQWPMEKELATGTLRYVKESTEGSVVTVSVNGTLRRNGSFESEGVTMSGATLTFTGTQSYSTITNSWKSAELKCEIGGRAKQGSRSGRVSEKFTLKMSSRPIGSESTAHGDHLTETTERIASPPQAESVISTTGVARDQFYPSGIAWEIPIAQPRNPVLASEYEIGNGRPERDVADSLLDSANQAKAASQFQIADRLYLQAIQRRPGFALAEYQRACNFALWNKPTEASDSFDRACELGMSDYPFCWQDDELGDVRRRPDFPQRLQEIRERYLAASNSKVGTPVVFVPSGRAPATKWPVIFLLHGYGDTNEAYFDQAFGWQTQGFVAVAMPASVPLSSRGFIWSEHSTDVTHEQIQRILDQMPEGAEVNRQEVSLLGFSQGAMHAVQVLVRHPETYRGLVAISPGGKPWQLSDNELAIRSGQRKNVWFAYGQQESCGEFVDLLETKFRSNGWSVRKTTHSGGHHFPKDWATLQPQVAAFLR